MSRELLGGWARNALMQIPSKLEAMKASTSIRVGTGLWVLFVLILAADRNLVIILLCQFMGFCAIWFISKGVQGAYRGSLGKRELGDKGDS